MRNIRDILKERNTFLLKQPLINKLQRKKVSGQPQSRDTLIKMRDVAQEGYKRTGDEWWLKKMQWLEKQLADVRLVELKELKQKAEETYFVTGDSWWQGIIEWADQVIAETKELL